MSKIISIGTAVPEFGTRQSKILDFMQEAYNDEAASRKLRILFNYSGIDSRYSVVSDFSKNQSEHSLFFENQNVPTIEKRLNLFKEHAVLLANEAIQNSLKKLNKTIDNFEITHLITVSCTGLYAPGIDAALIELLNLPNDIFHTSINFLGCNAAFPALKLADLIAKSDENAKVLVVCVELCTLHFQPKNDHDNLLSNTIFGDGAAAMIIVSDTCANLESYKGLALHGFYSLLLSKGKELMGWNITPVNFEMLLDARVPEFIASEVDDIVLKAGIKFDLTPDKIDKWAIHPGGKKILDTIKKQLKLDDEDLQYSYKILNQYGNMSSPTILFVLNELLQADHKPDEKIFSIGFGPGLSIETALLSYA